MKTFFTFILAASVVTLAGCAPTEATNATVNDTSRLDEMARRDAQSAEFADSVERYYQALEKKDWPTSYDMRTSDFKQTVIRSMYLKDMADSREDLTSFKVLGVKAYSDMSGGYMAAEIIMEFNDAGIDSYSCARWVSRGGKWLCEEPGLSGWLISTRIPDWTTQ